jgi:serine protease Do
MTLIFFFALFVFAANCFAADSWSTAANYLVRIETIGGLEKVGGEFANTGTSSGVLLDSDGYVMTSSFNFLHNPASIIVVLPDGTKQAAKRIASDKLRQLVLLKISGTATVPALAWRSKTSLRVGERCLAVGTVLSPHEPNIAGGIISGTDRIWGKAVQTDAAVGPNNYGGTLIDMNGKIIGILVPLSLTSDELTAGAELYDAGVGTAIPMEDVATAAMKLKNGNDLLPGYAGIRYQDNQTFVGNTVIFQVEPRSSAAVSGLTSGDRVLSIDGKTMHTALDVMKNLKLRYSGDIVRMEFQRNGQTQAVQLTLTAGQEH